MLRSHEPYAVIALDEADFWPYRGQELAVSLTYAFLLSEHIHFYFPMSNRDSRGVDRTFDRVLKGLRMVSKGIEYAKDLPSDEKARLLEGANLVVTSDIRVQRRVSAGSRPNLLLRLRRGRPPLIRWQYLENLEDSNLRCQIVVCSQLLTTGQRRSNLIPDPEIKMLRVSR